MKLKQLLIEKKHILLYILCGILTTVVSLLVCYVTVVGLSLIIHDGQGRPTALVDVLGSTTQWISGVLVAFFTNRAWVFTDAEKGREAAWRQLALFSGARLTTYFLEVGINLCAIALLSPWIGENAPVLNLVFVQVTLEARLWAKIVSSVLVVIANYYISKLLVFRKKGKEVAHGNETP